MRKPTNLMQIRGTISDRSAARRTLKSRNIIPTVPTPFPRRKTESQEWRFAWCHPLLIVLHIRHLCHSPVYSGITGGFSGWEGEKEGPIMRHMTICTSGGHMGYSREYWMIYRGPGFLAIVDSAPRPPSPHLLPSATCFSFAQSSCVSPIELTDGRGGRWWARSQIIRLQENLALYK